MDFLFISKCIDSVFYLIPPLTFLLLLFGYHHHPHSPEWILLLFLSECPEANRAPGSVLICPNRRAAAGYS